MQMRKCIVLHIKLQFLQSIRIKNQTLRDQSVITLKNKEFSWCWLIPSTTSCSLAHRTTSWPFRAQWRAKAVPHAPPPSTVVLMTSEFWDIPTCSSKPLKLVFWRNRCKFAQKLKWGSFLIVGYHRYGKTDEPLFLLQAIQENAN